MALRSNQSNSFDVAIIGGGIVGCFTAYYLAKRGVSVTLLEKGCIGGEQSTRNWGFVRQQGRDPAEVEAIQASIKLWSGMSEELDAEIGWRQNGILYLAETPKEMAEWEALHRECIELGFASQLVPKGKLGFFNRDDEERWIGGLTTDGDGQAEPTLVMAAMKSNMKELGVNIREETAVLSILTSGGRVSGVLTEKGEVHAPVVVCSAGVWSRLLLGQMGINFPQLRVRETALRTSAVPEIHRAALWNNKVGMRRRLDGGYTIARGSHIEIDLVPDVFIQFGAFYRNWLKTWRETHLRTGLRFFNEWNDKRDVAHPQRSPFVNERTLDPKPNRMLANRVMRYVRARFPSLRNAQISEIWGGGIDVTPDLVPVISRIDSVDGLILSTGFSGHGFGMGPIAGKLTSEIATGVKCTVDPHPFRFARFSNLSSLAPTTGV